LSRRITSSREREYSYKIYPKNKSRAIDPACDFSLYSIIRYGISRQYINTKKGMRYMKCYTRQADTIHIPIVQHGFTYPAFAKASAGKHQAPFPPSARLRRTSAIPAFGGRVHLTFNL